MSNIPTPQKLKELLDQNDGNLVLLDVRTPEEFATGHIKGAVNISATAPDFVSNIQELDKTKKYIVYCRSGGRSQMAQMLMKQSGLEVLNCQFGMMHLVNSPLEIEYPEQSSPVAA